MLNYFLGVSLVVFSEIFDSRIVFYVVSTSHGTHTAHTTRRIHDCTLEFLLNTEVCPSPPARVGTGRLSALGIRLLRPQLAPEVRPRSPSHDF
jgi:hypothetical protein